MRRVVHGGHGHHRYHSLGGWQAAKGWAQSLDVHGVQGWRLPSLADGELAQLLQVTLGNGAQPDGEADPQMGLH